MESPYQRKVIYVGSSQKDMRKLPEKVIDTFAFGIFQASRGRKHIKAKVLKGFSGAHVLEIIERDRGGTYRAV